MSLTTAIVDWVGNTQAYYNEKFRTPRKAPPYISTELSGFGISSDIWKDWNEEKRQRLAAKLSWIYSNIIRIGNEVSAADFNVFKKGTNERDIDHPFEQIMAFPNEFFSGTVLLQYLIWALSLDPNGAFWYLAPDSKTGELRQIWPVPLGKMKPIKDKNKFVSKYRYTAKNGKTTDYLPKYICHFVYAHPFDLYKSMTPLEASILVMQVYQGITNAQKNMYTQNIGTPTSVLSLDPNTSEPDFIREAQRIREDWANEPNRIAIVRAGTLDVKRVGLSSKELEIVSTQEFTRDEIDAIYMGGIQWRAKGVSGSDRDSINKEIKDAVIHPLHRLIAGQIQIQIMERFYNKGTPGKYIGKFDDIRAQDRSLNLQENTIYYHSMTMNETRAKQGLPAFEHEDLPGYGELPYTLMRNSAFVAKYYEIGSLGEEAPLPEEIGNLPESQDPEMMTNQLADGKSGIDIQAAIVDGMATELKRYKKVILRDFRKHGDSVKLSERIFDTNIIPANEMETIKTKLSTVVSEEEIIAIFSEWLR